MTEATNQRDLRGSAFVAVLAVPQDQHLSVGVAMAYVVARAAPPPFDQIFANPNIEAATVVDNGGASSNNRTLMCRSLGARREGLLCVFILKKKAKRGRGNCRKERRVCIK